MLPLSLIEPLRQQLSRVRALHQRDLREGFGSVYLPYALARKYPHASQRLELAVCVPCSEAQQRPNLRRETQTSRDGVGTAASNEGRYSGLRA